MLDDKINYDKRDADKIGVACKSFIREYKKFAGQSLADLMKDLVDNQNAALKNANRKEREAKQKALQVSARLADSSLRLI